MMWKPGSRRKGELSANVRGLRFMKQREEANWYFRNGE